MAILNVHQAKTRLSELIARAERGEEVVIARNGKPAVRLVPVSEKPSVFAFGSLKGQIELAPGWDEPMSEEELALFYDAPIFPDEDIEEDSHREPPS